MIHGLVFRKQRSAAAVGLPVQAGSRKPWGLHIRAGYKKTSAMKAVFMVLAAPDRQLWENTLVRDGKDEEDLNKVSSGLQTSHEVPHPRFCICTKHQHPSPSLYFISSEQEDKTKLS